MTDSYFAKLESDPYIDTNACDKKLHQALALLTPQKRHIVQMKYFDDLTFDEIAIITDININTVKASYYSAKKKYRNTIIKRCMKLSDKLHKELGYTFPKGYMVMSKNKALSHLAQARKRNS